MDDFNVLQVTTAQPKARATMRGSQGQKPRTKTKADREQPRRQEAERKKAEHEQELKDMLERQQTGKQPEQARKGKKSQLLQAEEIKQEVDDEDDEAGAEMFPAPRLKSVAAKKTQNQNLPVARPMKSAQSSRFASSKKSQGQDPAPGYPGAGMGGPSRTSTYQAAEEIHKLALAPTAAVRQAQLPKTAAAKKIHGLNRTPADRSSKLPAASGNQDQIADAPSAASSYPANSLPSTGRSALKEDTLQLLSSHMGSPRPYQTTGSWIMTAEMEIGDTRGADAVISSIEWDDANNPNLIDGTTSPRDFIRILGNQFPIWKPSDGDGNDLGTGDVFGAQLPPLDQRWKVFQTDIGDYDWKTGNIPPKFTRLDDLAVHLVLHSDIPKGKLGTFWPHDFAGSTGKVRRQRIRVGRPAIKDANADGNDKFEHTVCGGKAVALYYFTGTPNYQPVRYRPLPKAPDPSVAELSEEATRKRKLEAILDAEEAENPNRRAHGHNQYTPYDMRVKNGAPSGAKPKKKAHNLPPLPRPDTALTSSLNPIHTEMSLVGGIAESAAESVASEKKKAHKRALSEASPEELQEELQSRPGGGLISDDDEEDDLGDLIKRPKTVVSAKRSLLEALPTADNDLDDEDRPVTRRAFNVPRVLGMADRLDLEMRIAAHVLEANPSKEALAEEFAREHVKAEQSAKEIELLREMLPEAEEVDEF